MSMIEGYINDILTSLSICTVIASFEVVRKKIREKDGYLRARCVLKNDDFFEFSEYVHLIEGEVKVVDYSFQWQREGKLVKRWDNTPHHPEIETFPAHVHIGADSNVLAFPSVSFRDILQILESEINS